jgi:hypothetical protein
MNVLWNVYHYYSQFSEGVAARIRDLRSPIEKKLKDCVKIFRWEDVSHWAIKEAIKKVHKNLHKHIRQFQVSVWALRLLLDSKCDFPPPPPVIIFPLKIVVCLHRFIMSLTELLAVTEQVNKNCSQGRSVALWFLLPVLFVIVHLVALLFAHTT